MLEHYSNSLYFSSQGIWESKTRSEKISYPQDGHQSRVSVEKNSFWFNHRNECIKEIITRYPPRGALFDIGGGNGFVSLGLQQAGIETVLLEPGPEGAKNAKNRGLQHVVCSSFQDAGFRANSLPAIGVFDVVEHMKDDLAFLSILFEKLAPAGRLYITVPAFNALWSAKDIHEGHFRRYTISDIQEKLSRCGFEVEYSNYFFRFLFFPIYFIKAIPFKIGFKKMHNTVKGQQDHSQLDGIANQLINRMTAKEIGKIRANRKISYGSSVIVVARPKK